MGGICKSVNVVGRASNIPFDNVPYDIAYNKVVHYIGNSVIGSRSAFPRKPKNQG